MFSIVVYPISAGVTVERIAFYFYTDESLTEQHREGRKAVADAILQVNNEDIAIVESCQRGRHSPAFAGGVFMTNQEATSLLVQRVFAGRLLEQLGAGGRLRDTAGQGHLPRPRTALITHVRLATEDPHTVRSDQTQQTIEDSIIARRASP